MIFDDLNFDYPDILAEMGDRLLADRWYFIKGHGKSSAKIAGQFAIARSLPEILRGA